MELRHIRYLLAVAEHGSFTRAAEALHVSQPTLSQQVRQLERDLGATLLDRSTRVVRLTDVGQSYTEHARRALRALTAAERSVREVRDLATGRLRIGATPTVTGHLLPPLVERFHARHPAVVLEIRDTTEEHVETALLADDLDLGIVAGRTRPVIGLTGSVLLTERIALAVGPRHPWHRRRKPVSLELLGSGADDPAGSDHRLALLTRRFSTRVHIDEHFAAHGVAPDIAMEANSVAVLVEIARRCPVAAILPDTVVRAHPDLYPVGLTPALPTREVVLLRRTSPYLSSAAREFLSLAVER